jgi:membrane protein
MKRAPAWAIPFALGLLGGLGVGLLEGRWRGRRRARGASCAPKASSPPISRARDWRSAVGRTWTAFNSNRIPAVAAGATFFGLLSLFPALGVFVSLYGLFANVVTARTDFAIPRGLVPDAAIAILSAQIRRLAAAPHAQLGLAFLVSALVSIWSANAGMKALIAGLNVAYNATERRGFFRLNATSLGFTIASVGLVALEVAAPGWLSRIGPRGSPIIAVLRWPVLLATILALLSLLYRYAPSRARPPWRWVAPGSLFAAIAWVAMSMLFSFYVANFANYDRTYGSLGAIVGFMTWIWLSLTVLLVGAEVNAQLEPISTPTISA